MQLYFKGINQAELCAYFGQIKWMWCTILRFIIVALLWSCLRNVIMHVSSLIVFRYSSCNIASNLCNPCSDIL